MSDRLRPTLRRVVGYYRQFGARRTLDRAVRQVILLIDADGLTPGPLDTGSAGAFRIWDTLKRDHPTVARILAPPLRTVWRLTLRWRPSWGEMRRHQVIESVYKAQTHGGVRPLVASHSDLRPALEDRERLVAAAIERVVLVPGTGVFMIGWLFDPLRRIVRITARAGASTSEDLLPGMARFERADIAEAYAPWAHHAVRDGHGFACLVRLDEAALKEDVISLSLEVADEVGQTWFLYLRHVVEDGMDPLASIRDILTLIPPQDPEVLDRHIGPAVSALWQARERRDPLGSANGAKPRKVARSLRQPYHLVDIGEPPSDALVSIIIPIPDRYDVIEYQMALFADEPAMRTAELIYVVSNPAIGDRALRLARGIQPLFQVPCRLVLCGKSYDLVQAANLGASIASGEVLLLLGADVMPAKTGWLSGLLDALGRLPAPGVVGPRLLYPDGSLRDGGIQFSQEPWYPGIWLNAHPGRGLPPDGASDHEPRRVPAITTACMMVSRDLYARVGGLDEGFSVEDYVATDFCLKIREQGGASYVAPWIELYQVGLPSQPRGGFPDGDQSLLLCNAWLQTNRWGRVLEHARMVASDT